MKSFRERFFFRSANVSMSACQRDLMSQYAAAQMNIIQMNLLSSHTPYPITTYLVYADNRRRQHTNTQSHTVIVCNSKIQIQWKMSNDRSRLGFLFYFSFILCTPRHSVCIVTLCSRTIRDVLHQYGLTFTFTQKTN